MKTLLIAFVITGFVLAGCRSKPQPLTEEEKAILYTTWVLSLPVGPKLTGNEFNYRSRAN